MVTEVPVEDAAAVNQRASEAFYAPRQKIFPKAVRGRYRTLKWIAMAVLLAIYWGVPWLRWDRGAHLPDQAVLLDLPARRFYFFFIEIWPQEFYYITGLLVLAAIGLFFVTALAGRVWCGYACPQTVWTDLYIFVERYVEGDRNAQMRLDKARWSLAKLRKRITKHCLWLVIALLTGGAWILYFADAPTLLSQLVTFSAPAPAYITIAFLTGSTYLLAGFAREQVCTYMCPYARFQSAMFDEETLIVSYDHYRGEPRGSHKKGASWEGRGDCVDCNQCVAVCPTGIDIRDGQQMQCITCALCVDVCNGVMDRVGRPRGLIRYDTSANLALRGQGKVGHVHPIRMRTIVYVCVMALAGGLMLYTLLTRASFSVNVLHDRNPLFVMLSDGSVRNAYTVKILNKYHDTGSFRLAIEGPPGAEMKVVGLDSDVPDSIDLTVGSDRLESHRVLVSAPARALDDESVDVAFVVTDLASGEVARQESVFRGPEK